MKWLPIMSASWCCILHNNNIACQSNYPKPPNANSSSLNLIFFLALALALCFSEPTTRSVPFSFERSGMSPSNSPCAACKIQRRKCTQDCVFAPYFPPDNPQRFSYVHKVYGASNVAKILSDINPAQREDAVKSLAYEAEARLRDPVYGCVGVISVLQHRLKQVQAQLHNAKKELATYNIGPPGPGASLQVPPHVPPTMMPPAMIGIPANGGQLMMGEHQMFEAQAQQMAAANAMAAREQEEMLQQEILRLNDGSGSGMGFSDMASSAANAMSPSMLLGPHLSNPFHIHQTEQPQPQHHHSLHRQLQAQLMLNTHQPTPHQSPLSPSHPNSQTDDGISTSI